LVFDTAEFGLAVAFENLADRTLRRRFDIVVEVGESPAQLIGQHPADGRFARGHEAHHVQARRALQNRDHPADSVSRLIAAIRLSTNDGSKRSAITKSQPVAGVTTVRALRSTPRRMARAHCAAVMANRLPCSTFSGGRPAST